MRAAIDRDEDADAFRGFDDEARFVEVVAESLHESEQQRVVSDRRVATAEMIEHVFEQLGSGTGVDCLRRLRFTARVGARAAGPDVGAAARTLLVPVHRDDRPEVTAPRATRRIRRGFAQDIVTTSSSSISACSRFWIAINVPLVELGQLPHAPW